LFLSGRCTFTGEMFLTGIRSLIRYPWYIKKGKSC
jgi:hypothetical protein